MPETNAYAISIVKLLEVKLELKALEDEETFLTNMVKQGLDTNTITKDDVKALGLTPTNRNGGYRDDVLVLLKTKSLTDCWQTKDVLVQSAIREHEDSGRLTRTELDPYRKPDSFYCTLPKGN